MPTGPQRSESRTGQRRQIRARGKRILLVVAWSGILALVAISSATWIGFKAATINRELNAANDLLPELRSNVLKDNSAAVDAMVKDLRRHTSSARAAATDPLWTMAGALPWVGVNFQAASQVATTADDVAQLGIAPLVGVFNSLDWKGLIANEDGLNLKPLADAQPKIVTAAGAVRQSSDRLNSIDANSLIPQISTPLRRAQEELTGFSTGLNSAADAATLLPRMLGDGSPRRYLLLMQNNAETRATGGIPGALAVLTVENGRVSLGSQTSASAIGAFSPVVDVDPEQQAIFSARLGKFMQDVNLTPDFPTVAATASSMWQQRTKEPLDGVVAVDPIALSYILEAMGPVKLSDPQLRDIAGESLPTLLTGSNVVPTLLSDVYKNIPEPRLQDGYFAGVAQEVFAKLSSGVNDTQKLIDGLTRAASERRILLWSASAQEESIVARYPLGGSITGTNISPSQFGVYFNDGTGAKMDYHVKRTVQMFKGCPAGDYSQVKVRVTSTNTAPKDAATSLPEYVTGGGAFGVPPGNVQTNIVAYGPVQSNVENVYVAGKKTGFASQRHAGRPVGTVTIQLAPGDSSVVEFTFGKIVQHTDPVVAVTPTVQSLKDVIRETESAACTPAA